jgi:hypothetical protein
LSAASGLLRHVLAQGFRRQCNSEVARYPARKHNDAKKKWIMKYISMISDSHVFQFQVVALNKCFLFFWEVGGAWEYRSLCIYQLLYVTLFSLSYYLFLTALYVAQKNGSIFVSWHYWYFHVMLSSSVNIDFLS